MPRAAADVPLRDPTGPQSVTFLELFFDLVYVFAVTQLSHGLLEHLNWTGVAQTAVLLLAVWWAWSSTGWFTNFFAPERPSVRLVLLALMLAALVMSVGLPEAFGDRSAVFVGAYLALQIGRHLYMVVALRGHPLARTFSGALVWFCFAGIPWVAGTFVDGWARLALWAFAVLVDYAAVPLRYPVPGLGRTRIVDVAVSNEHLLERYRLFLILSLGESILVTGATFAQGDFSTVRTASFVIAFIGSVALWWTYFGDGSLATADTALETAQDAGRAGRFGARSTYTHVLLVAGILVAAVGANSSSTTPPATPP